MLLTKINISSIIHFHMQYSLNKDQKYCSSPIPMSNKMCRFGINCNNPHCKFNHQKPKEPCRFGTKCKRSHCWFSHEPQEQLYKNSKNHQNQRNHSPVRIPRDYYEQGYNPM